MPVYAEVLAIGDELTSGQRIDTNSAWLSQKLTDLGIRVLYHTTCADDLQACTTALEQALGRADVVVSTGGLGPTADDLTRDAIAAAIGSPLALRAEALEHLEQLFRRRGRVMSPNNRLQAMLPEASDVIANPHGTAPGIAAVFKRPSGELSHLFALPGVPAEMRQMWDATVAPKLRQLFPRSLKIVHRRLKCFGVGESQLEQMLPDLIRRGRSPTVGITVHHATITLRVTAEGESEEACSRQMEPTLATIRQCLGDLVFGQEDDELQHAVTRLLAAGGQSLATVEMGTPGLLSHWLHAASRELAAAGRAGPATPSTPAPPACPFAGGLVVDSRQALQRLLDIKPADMAAPPEVVTSDLATSDLATSHPDPCAEAVYWQAVATAGRQQFAADLGLAVGEFPSVQHDSATDRCWIGVSSTASSWSFSHDLAGHPDIVAQRAAKQALNVLRLMLLQTGT